MGQSKLVKELEEKIEYSFKSKDIIMTALTHSSYANENKKSRTKVKFNERLEFLGDSVLSLMVSDHLFKRYPKYSEGKMTKTRALLVCEGTLYIAAKKLDLGKYLLVGKGEEKGGGRFRPSILADAFEALVGAIYLDGGVEEAFKFLRSHLLETLEDTLKADELFVDYKTKIQEIVQKDPSKTVEYKLVGEEGPDHEKVFMTELYISDELNGKGKGKTKKESEQNAAKEYYEKLVKDEK